MIQFDQVTRDYGTKRAVDRLDLTIPGGELFAFLGPNGAGKTTTIKMLVGLLRPTLGSVKVCGFDSATQTRQANLQMGYVPDQPHLYDKLTGREFLWFIAEMFGLELAEAEQRIAREITNFELAGFVDDLTERYSHGMKQRTVFAAAMLHDPAVLVLDEPMVGLDPHSVRLVKDLMRQKVAGGDTVFMSTHTLTVAEEIADRIGIVSHGRVVFLGTIAELREQMAMSERSLEELYLELLAMPSAASSENSRAAEAGSSPDETRPEATASDASTGGSRP